MRPDDQDPLVVAQHPAGVLRRDGAARGGGTELSLGRNNAEDEGGQERRHDESNSHGFPGGSDQKE